MRTLLGLAKPTTRWHVLVISLGAYVAAQPPLHSPEVGTASALGLFIGYFVGFYLVTRGVMAVMAAVERRTSLWPSRILPVPVYCGAFAAALALSAVATYEYVGSEPALAWGTASVPGNVLGTLFFRGLPLLLLAGGLNWVRLGLRDGRD